MEAQVPPTNTSTEEKTIIGVPLLPSAWRNAIFGNKTVATPAAPQNTARPSAAKAAYSPERGDLAKQPES